MEVQTQVLQAVSKFLNIPIGQIPEKGGTVMELAPSSTPRRFFNGESYDQMSVLILSKVNHRKLLSNRLILHVINAERLICQAAKNGR